LLEAMDVCGKIGGIAFVHFNERDVVRHNLVQQIIKAYEEFDATQAARSAQPATSENGRQESGK
jgi:phosphate starvation-inducible protein PhoH and related proteins